MDKTLLKRELTKALPGGFSEAGYDVEYFMKRVEIAIERARKLDINPREPWPNRLGTWVYRLVKKIKKSK